MNKQDLKQLSPRPFPKKQYKKLTRKIGLYLTLPILVILIGGGIGGTYYYRNYHRPHQNVHEKVQKRPTVHQHTSHQPKSKLKPINVKQGEHLLGHWLKQLHYPAAKAQAILTTYQKRNENKELKFSQTLNQLTHGTMNNRAKTQNIQKLINQL